MSKNIESKPKLRLSFFLLFQTFIFVVFSLLMLNATIMGSRYLRFIENPPVKDIQKIELYSIDGNKEILIRTIDDLETIEKISRFLSASVGYLPNHPRYTKESYVVFYLNDGNKYEFIFYLIGELDKTVYIDFVKKNGGTTSFYGNAKIIDKDFLKFLISLDLFQK